jgi:hypothetical protein
MASPRRRRRLSLKNESGVVFKRPLRGFSRLEPTGARAAELRIVSSPACVLNQRSTVVEAGEQTYRLAEIRWLFGEDWKEERNEERNVRAPLILGWRRFLALFVDQ